MYDVAARRAADAKYRLWKLGQVERLSGYRRDPVGYATEELKLELTGDQRAMMESVVRHRRTAIKASHAIGKTFAAAVLACWWYDCWDQHICYVTAPSWKQALGLTFKQVKLLRRRLKLPGAIHETGWVKDRDKALEPGHFIQAVNAESGEGFQGEHTAPILVVMEEAPGVPHYIQAAAEGLMTSPECRIVQVGNPTDEATGFGKACSDPGYNVLTVSVLDHPNIGLELEAKPPLFPEAVRLLWLAEMLARECEVVEEGTGDAFEFWDTETIRSALEGTAVSENPKARKWWYLPNAVFQGRALGIFPSQADEQVIPRGWLDRCGVLTPTDPLAFGMDVARHGDDRTVIAWRRGPCLLGFRELRQMDNAAVTGALLMLLNGATDERREDPHSVPLSIDVTGGLGAGPCDFLAERGYNAVGVNASQMADDPETYPNQRSELWFQMRDRVRAREADFSALTAEERKVVFRELSTPKWKPDGRGRKVVEPKVEIKKRLGSSPDIADAVNLAFRSSLPVTVEDEDDAWGGSRF